MAPGLDKEREWDNGKELFCFRQLFILHRIYPCYVVFILVPAHNPDFFGGIVCVSVGY